jgi:hypothetical protein
MATLKLFYSHTRQDNFTTATADGERDALNAGYRFVRFEGYVYRNQDSSRIPLKLFYSHTRQDNFTTAKRQGERDALNAGYRFVRIEEYLRPGNLSDDVILNPQ